MTSILRSLLSALTMVFLIAQGISAAPLREQLKAAASEKDSYALIELIRRILDTGPDDALEQRLVTLWMAVSDYEMAEQTLHAWKTVPAGFRALIEADILWKRDQDRAAAVAGLESYHARQPDDREVTLRLVEMLSDQNDVQRIDEVLTATPGVDNDPYLLLRRARARRSLNRFEQALSDFAAAEQIDAEMAANDRPAFDRMRAALPALYTVTEKLGEHPDDFPLLIQRALLYREVGTDPAWIAADAKAALAVHPQSLAATLLYAATLPRDIALEKYSVDFSSSAPSDEDLNQLVEWDLRLAKNPRDLKALIARGLVLNHALQYRLGLLDAEAALKIDSAQSSAHRVRFHALMQLGWITRAIEVLPEMQKAKVPAFDLAAAYDELAVKQLESNHYEEALEYATMALKAKPSVERYQTRATVRQRLGKDVEARKDLQQAQALKKSS